MGSEFQLLSGAAIGLFASPPEREAGEINIMTNLGPDD